MKETLYNRGTFEAIHASAKLLLKIGAIDKANLRNFNETCPSYTQ